jgi:hypothetical protein
MRNDELWYAGHQFVTKGGSGNRDFQYPERWEELDCQCFRHVEILDVFEDEGVVRQGLVRKETEESQFGVVHWWKTAIVHPEVIRLVLGFAKHLPHW